MRFPSFQWARCLHLKMSLKGEARWRSLVAGSAAGLAASLAMTQFQNLWSKASEKLNGNGKQSSSDTQSSEQNEDATMKAAGKIAKVAGYSLSHEQKKKAGPIVHY